MLNWRDPWHPEGGGSEVYVQHIAEELVGAGMRVTVFTAHYPGAPRCSEHNGVTYVRRGGRLSVYLRAAWALATRRLGKVDAVLEVQNGMPFLATLFTKAPVTVLVHHVHREQWPIFGPRVARIGWFLESRVAVRANRANRYVAVSSVTRDELVELGVDQHRISIAWNGQPPVPAYVDAGPAPEPTLVVLGRLVPHKQVEHAIEAVAALRPDFPGLRLVIMGSGWWHDELTRRVAELDLGDAVAFLGHVDEETKYAVLSSAWVHLLPSIKEGWGISVIEAAQTGVPTVAYASAGGVRDSVLDGVTGTLAHDRADFNAQVARLLSDEELRSEMGAKARHRAGQLTWRASAETVAEALDS
ncbi:glycosyltransferase family 4 protein [Nocardioides sp. AE5]|uniref:glycosyltransferase family 4 protein n=1 Tax=Nocardioides sp. AE5 TaxID=2962573 RepID=UPI00288140FA|nr:glycosyltransferase family 4 protein [Nocardioides sp. AE5]MDT0201315.1 glycosyltransferase family 4 protein [Nocardioides sp. AE5]